MPASVLPWHAIQSRANPFADENMGGTIASETCKVKANRGGAWRQRAQRGLPNQRKPRISPISRMKKKDPRYPVKSVLSVKSVVKNEARFAKKTGKLPENSFVHLR
jgi:hypothetical protein